jgi:hypothetical protein
MPLWLAIFFATAGLVVALASLLMRLASTHPDTAVSNLSEWAKRFGVHKIPTWLADKRADDVARKWASNIRAISGLVLILVGVAWYWSSQTTVGPRVVPPAPPTASPSLAPQSSEQTPINWQPDFQMNWYSGSEMAWIRFVGNSTTLAHIKDAYIVSKLTGHREPLEVANATNFNERWNVNQIEPIPPGATTMLVYEPKPSPSIQDFLNQWGAFEFHVVYDGGEYTKIYSQDYVHEKFASELPGIYGPHITPKDTK